MLELKEVLKKTRAGQQLKKQNQILFKNYCNRERDLVIELGSILSDEGKWEFTTREQGWRVGEWEITKMTHQKLKEFFLDWPNKILAVDGSGDETSAGWMEEETEFDQISRITKCQGQEICSKLTQQGSY